MPGFDICFSAHDTSSVSFTVEDTLFNEGGKWFACGMRVLAQPQPGCLSPF
jgi:hypothetical protein